MLSRWENGHDVPDAVDQRLLCRAYGQGPDELGLVPAGTGAGSVPRIAPPMGSEMVGYFRNVFSEHLRADNLMGPHHLVDVVRAQAELLDRMLPSARGEIRDELLLLAFRYNEFAGWLYQDASNPDQAMRYTDRSVDYALEIGSPREMSYVLMRKADIAADLGNPDRALGLTQAALREARHVSPRGRALVLRLQGRAHARLGNQGECARALDAAYEAISRDAEPDGITDYCTPAYIGMEAANCWSTLGRFDVAVATFEESLRAWPHDLRRDYGLCLARFSAANAGREDLERMCAAGRQAVEVVRSAPSSRALDELQRLRVRLAPWRRNAEVSDLGDRIRSLLAPVT